MVQCFSQEQTFLADGTAERETKSSYNNHIKPTLKKVKKYRGERKAVKAATVALAQARIEAQVSWTTATTRFDQEDTTVNTPMGTWDTAEMAKGNFYSDKGPKTIRGTNYNHYVDC